MQFGSSWRKSVKFLVCFFALTLLLPRSQAAQSVGSGKSLSETEKAGRRMFVDRCSVCHLGVPPKNETYGPFLNRALIAAVGEDEVRKKIMDGSQKMPGWKYVFTPADVDKIIAYLKTVEMRK
jgi:mono/diheme cytochrome c family protein